MASKINVNGVDYTIEKGEAVVIIGDKINVRGAIDTTLKEKIDITITGDPCFVDCNGSLTVHGDINGNVDVSGNITCGNVEQSVDAGGNVTCHNVSGMVDAGGNVICNEARGKIDAGGNVIVNKLTNLEMSPKEKKKSKN
jgi:hypothetical protein